MWHQAMCFCFIAVGQSLELSDRLDSYVSKEILWRGSHLHLLAYQVTRSEWDHVALVVPGDATARFKLLEATGDGVVTSPMVALLIVPCIWLVMF